MHTALSSEIQEVLERSISRWCRGSRERLEKHRNKLGTQAGLDETAPTFRVRLTTQRRRASIFAFFHPHFITVSKISLNFRHILDIPPKFTHFSLIINNLNLILIQIIKFNQFVFENALHVDDGN